MSCDERISLYKEIADIRTKLLVAYFTSPDQNAQKAKALNSSTYKKNTPKDLALTIPSFHLTIF